MCGSLELSCIGVWLGGQAYLVYWFCGGSSELRFGRKAVSSAVCCCVQVSFGGITKALVCVPETLPYLSFGASCLEMVASMVEFFGS